MEQSEPHGLVDASLVRFLANEVDFSKLDSEGLRIAV